MRIWLAPSSFAPHRGGVEEACLQLARHLDAEGHEVRVVVPRHPSVLAEREVHDGIRVDRISFTAPRMHLGSLLGFPAALASQVGRLLRLQRSWRPDVVNIHCVSTQTLAVVIACLVTRTPIVLTTHGETAMDSHDIFRRSRYLRAVLRLAVRRAGEVVACSAWTAEVAGRIAPGLADVEIIGNGIDPTQWSVTSLPAEPVLLAWGRHVHQKGFDLLLEAFAVLREDLPDARLLLGGEGEETPRLRKLAGPGVELVGPLDRDEVADALGRSRVVVVPSRVEPFGIVALEAMAAGRTVVRSNRGGLSEATGGFGFEADPTSRDDLALAMRRALEHPLEASVLRAWAQDHTWDAVCSKYVALYARTIGSVPAASRPRAGELGPAPGRVPFLARRRRRPDRTCRG